MAPRETALKIGTRKTIVRNKADFLEQEFDLRGDSLHRTPKHHTNTPQPPVSTPLPNPPTTRACASHHDTPGHATRCARTR